MRRRRGTPPELTASVVLASDEMTLDPVVRVVGTRWTIESGFDAAKRAVGRDHAAVRSGIGWDRPVQRSGEWPAAAGGGR